MNVSVGEHWEQFVDGLVKGGRYGTASEVIREGLRLIEAREAKLKALRDTIEASITEGGAYSDEEVAQYLVKRKNERRAVRAAE